MSDLHSCVTVMVTQCCLKEGLLMSDLHSCVTVMVTQCCLKEGLLMSDPHSCLTGDGHSVLSQGGIADV